MTTLRKSSQLQMKYGMRTAHAKDANLRYGECSNYEDLLIAVGNGVAIGKNSIGLGSATDVNTLGDVENRDARIEDLTFDAENEAFVALTQDELPSSGSTPPSGLPEVPEASTQKRNLPKRSRTQYEATSGSTDNIMEEIKKLSNTLLSLIKTPFIFFKCSMENHEILEEEIEAEEMEEDIDEEEEIELYENVRLLLLTIKTVIILLGKIAMMRRRIERSLQRQLKSRTVFYFINNMIEGDPQSFRQLYRMYPDAFMKLCSIIKEKTHLEDTRYVCVEEMVATFLIIVGHNDRYCNVSQRFHRSHFATSQNFNKILKALNTIAPDMMVKTSTGIPAKVKESIRFMPFFKNVLAACNFDLQFIYVLSGWEGSAHDSKLLSDALSRTNGLQVPQGYFLVDCGFANRRQFLAPLHGIRYHLKDFGGQGRHPRNASELFNLRHASLRNVIERTFGVFKSRFTIFKTAHPFPFQIQAELVLACAGLHNFLRKECRSDEFPVEYEGDQDVTPLDAE
ncbi:nuclease HARBI1-like protein [Perilla frutescens var. hirtella]|nr:nuclease HARBI1-like protein [Perilla frutescens var. hirtella]